MNEVSIGVGAGDEGVDEPGFAYDRALAARPPFPPIRIPVSDHGHVDLIDLMGDEHEPVRAARLSYGHYGETRAWGPGPNTDGQLTAYLLEHGHTTPFEMIELKFRVKMPIFVARQWIRHRMASINEYSMRYSPAITDVHIPEVYRLQDKVNKQGSVGVLDPHLTQRFRGLVAEHAARGFEIYEEMVLAGVAKEQAREHLGLNMYTEIVWKIDLHNLLHFLSLRMDSHAQLEMQEYAIAIYHHLVALYPRLMALWSELKMKS